jgi:hypothetical protein
MQMTLFISLTERVPAHGTHCRLQSAAMLCLQPLQQFCIMLTTAMRICNVLPSSTMTTLQSLLDTT